MVVTHFRPQKLYEKCLYLTSTQVAARFAQQLKVSSVAVDRVLRELGYEWMRSKDGGFWKVVEYQRFDTIFFCLKNASGGQCPTF